MREFSGKKLLILGAYRTEAEIVRCARAMGARAIVTDNHEDWSLAPAKHVADEAWDVSWSDIGALRRKCIDEGVDGVIAGFSERRVSCASELCSALGLPFYADGADTRTIFDKSLFRRACASSGIDVPRCYGEEDRNIRFPVIVKPVDNGGSRGVSICWDVRELEKGVALARKNSDSGEVVIEEYIVADEVMTYYVVHNGVATISAMCDRYMRSFDPQITQLPVGYRFPSRHLDFFMEKHNERFRNLIRSLGVSNGLIAFQSFVKDGRVMPFDPTFRLDGTMAYRATEKINGSNVLEMLIRHSLTGSMGDDASIEARETPRFSVLAFELPVLLGKGMIARVSGLDEAREADGVYFVHEKVSAGDVMERPADFSQMLCRIQLVAEDEEDLEAKLSSVLGCVVAEGVDGRDMVLFRDARALARGEVER